VVLLAAGMVFAVIRLRERDRAIIEQWEAEREVQELREDYGNRDPYEFLELPGVRGSADSNVERFRERRDEILQRYRDDGTGSGTVRSSGGSD
jgi:hypothetical protein